MKTSKSRKQWKVGPTPAHSRKHKILNFTVATAKKSLSLRYKKNSRRRIYIFFLNCLHVKLMVITPQLTANECLSIVMCYVYSATRYAWYIPLLQVSNALGIIAIASKYFSTSWEWFCCSISFQYALPLNTTYTHNIVVQFLITKFLKEREIRF